MQKRIYLCLAHMSGNEQRFIQEAFDTNWVVPLGPNVNEFERELKEYTGNEQVEVVALSSGTAAIHLAEQGNLSKKDMAPIDCRTVGSYNNNT